MIASPTSAPVPANPSDFETIASLLGANGLVTKTLSPAPSRRSLARQFKAARIPFWKANSGATRGGGAVYYHRGCVEVWLARNTWTGVDA